MSLQQREEGQWQRPLGLLAGQRKEAELQAQISVNLFVLTPPRHDPRVRVATPQSVFLQKPTLVSNNPARAPPARFRTRRQLQSRLQLGPHQGDAPGESES